MRPGYATDYRVAPVEPAPPVPPVTPVEPPPLEQRQPVEEQVPVEPVTEVLVAPTRRMTRRPVPPRAPTPEPEWTAEDQRVDEEPQADRIPDAMDVLSVPAAESPPARTTTRRFSAPAATSAAPPTPPPPVTVTDDAPTAVAAEPPTWTPPPPPSKAEKSGGAGQSILAIVLSVLVPVIGAIAGLFIATRARARGAALAGLARAVAIVALVVWLIVGAFALIAARDQGSDYSKLKVGNCFDSSTSNEVRSIKVKSCAKEHNSEVFFLVTDPAGKTDAYPGKDALVQFAADACLGQPLTDYLGMPLEQSKFKDFEIVPQESAWKDGRRLLVCGIDTGGEARVKGSAKAAKP